jgi:hypothetical protein|tara:strand:- start:242 stop:652 length:411 start_codon:yes stop_codon:yes gene_type:complete
MKRLIVLFIVILFLSCSKNKINLDSDTLSRYSIVIENENKYIADSLNVYLKKSLGVYIAQPWGSETYIQSWNNHLAMLDLPSNSPDLTIYKKIEKDIFKRVLKNGELGEELKILRDKNKLVIGFKSHQNIYYKSKK